MIVRCPSCRTLFKHPTAGSGQGRCSRCDSLVPLRPMPQAYLVMGDSSPGSGAQAARGDTRIAAGVPAAAGPERLALGMDDPGLAQRLERTALDDEQGSTRRALTYQVEAGVADGTGPAKSSKRPATDSRSASAVSPTARHRGRPAATRRVARAGRSSAGKLVAVVVLATGMAIAGGYLSPHVPLTARDSILGGAAAGMLLGWTWLRWKSVTSRR